MLINIWGVNLASYTNKIAVIAEIAAVIIFGIVLLIATLIHHEARIDLLMTRPAAPTPYWPGFMLASLLGAWTIIGFEVAGDLSEETLNVRRIAPQSIVCSVLTTIILGFLFLVALTLAIPDLASVTAASDPISTIMAFHLGTIATKIFLIFVVTAMFAVGLLVIAAGARVLFAAARDKRLIGASHLTHISTHRVPVKAVGVVALVEITVFLLAKDAVDIYAAATVVFYTVYLLTVLSFAFGVKKLPPPQSFSLGAWRRPVVVLAVLWLAGMIGVLTIPEEFHNAAIIAGGIIAVVLIICLITRRKIA
jgi:amino acid transporter